MREYKMEAKVCIFTQAHNSEDTIGETIRSVLNQKYKNFTYYICDSGSNDSTAKVIERFAKVDKRIVPIYKRENDVWYLFSLIKKISRTDEYQYLAQIDADDIMDENFLAMMVEYAQENRLDIVSCCSRYVDGNTGTDISRVNLEYNILIDSPDLFDRLFPVYFRYIRDSWGKIFNINLFKDFSYDSAEESIRNGSVSTICFDALFRANKIGVMWNKLHTYYVYSNSFERSLESKPRLVTSYLYDKYYNVMQEKCGQLSSETRLFLYNNYIYSLKLKYAQLDKLGIEDSLKKLYKCEISRGKLATEIISNRDVAFKIPDMDEQIFSILKEANEGEG